MPAPSYGVREERGPRHRRRASSGCRRMTGAAAGWLLVLLVVAFSPPRAGAGDADVDALALKLMSKIEHGSKVVLLPLNPSIGLPDEAHQRFYEELAGALERNVAREIRIVAGPRLKGLYRHLEDTWEADLGAGLKEILKQAKADFVVVCLWTADDPEGFEISCAPAGMETPDRLSGGGVRFGWRDELEYLEFVVARLGRQVLGGRDVGPLQEVRVHDRRTGGETDLTDFVTGHLHDEAIEVARERGLPGVTGGGGGWSHRMEGEIWHLDDGELRLWVYLYGREGAGGSERRVSSGDVILATASLPPNLRPLERELVDETLWASKRATIRARPGSPRRMGGLRAGDEVFVTARVRGRRGRQWLEIALADGRLGYVLASSFGERADPAALEAALGLTPGERTSIRWALMGERVLGSGRGGGGELTEADRALIRTWQAGRGAEATGWLKERDESDALVAAGREAERAYREAKAAAEEEERREAFRERVRLARSALAARRVSEARGHVDRLGGLKRSQTEAREIEELKSALAALEESERERARAESEERGLGLGHSDRTLVERALASRGFEVGEVDGEFDSATRSAVRDDQRRRGLPETGYLTRPQYEALIDLVKPRWAVGQEIREPGRRRSGRSSATAATVPRWWWYRRGATRWARRRTRPSGTTKFRCTE